MRLSRRAVVIDLILAGAGASVPQDPVFASFGAVQAASPWTGAMVTLAQDEAVSMPVTPDGSMLLAYRNVSTMNSAGKLSWTSGGNPPVLLGAPALALTPNVFAHDWGGNNLTITNVSDAANTPIDVAAYGPGLGATPVPLPVGSTGVQLAQSQSAEGQTTGGWMQLGFLQSSGDPAVFGFIGGPVNADGTNAYVIGLNSLAGNTGPTTGKTPPPGYYATSSGNRWSYQLNWPSGLLYVAYFGAAQVVTGLAAAAEQLPTVTLIRL